MQFVLGSLENFFQFQEFLAQTLNNGRVAFSSQSWVGDRVGSSSHFRDSAPKFRHGQFRDKCKPSQLTRCRAVVQTSLMLSVTQEGWASRAIGRSVLRWGRRHKYMPWQRVNNRSSEVSVTAGIEFVTSRPAYYWNCITLQTSLPRATQYRCWSAHNATNRSVAGLIPDEVFGSFNVTNPSSLIIALGSLQPLTEMSTKDYLS
jgi:hypothetical protein